MTKGAGGVAVDVRSSAQGSKRQLYLVQLVVRFLQRLQAGVPVFGRLRQFLHLLAHLLYFRQLLLCFALDIAGGCLWDEARK